MLLKCKGRIVCVRVGMKGGLVVAIVVVDESDLGVEVQEDYHEEDCCGPFRAYFSPAFDVVMEQKIVCMFIYV